MNPPTQFSPTLTERLTRLTELAHEYGVEITGLRLTEEQADRLVRETSGSIERRDRTTTSGEFMGVPVEVGDPPGKMIAVLEGALDDMKQQLAILKRRIVK